MLSYDVMLDLAKSHGFSSFTQLQEEAFRNERVYEPRGDLFVIGETSSGKTLIPLLLYEAAIREAEKKGVDYPRMLFVVPYRALAAQKLQEIRAFFAGRDIRIVQSTGEFRQDDEEVRKGRVHVAVIITEKAFRYEACAPGFLSLYDYIVLDEVGLVSDATRGVRLDFIFAWAMNQRALNTDSKVIALGTPFFDWSEYIRSYGFIEVRANKRPVSLHKVDVVYAKKCNGILEVKGNCPFLYPARLISRQKMENMRNYDSVPKTSCEMAPDEMCAYDEPCRHDPLLLCPHTGKACVERIRFTDDNVSKFNDTLLCVCREHLEKGHQILVFVNDRDRVRTLCSMLYENLQEYFPTPPSADECKKQILAECGLEADDVFGIMEYEETVKEQNEQKELFRAFWSGIGFHCASLPNEMRSYVEKKLLDSREMRIVCSTETLAFGVNSTVDVAIIADLYKYDGAERRPLTMNEYQNYAGRAGRLRHGKKAEDVKGYVYTFIRESERGLWQDMNKQKDEPECLHSLFYEDQQQYMAFFVLNLLPAESVNALSEESLLELVGQIPGDKSISEEELKDKLRESLQFLQEQGLLIRIRSQGLGRQQRTQGVRYCLTEHGKHLRGYIIRGKDYQLLLEALEEYIGNSVFIDGDRVKYLYRLLNTKHVENGLNSVFHNSTTRVSLQEAREYVREHVTDVNHSTEWIDECYNERIMCLLSALLAWCDGESPRTLYRRFGVHYALLSKTAEQIAYLIEITTAILLFRMQKTWEEKGTAYERLSINYEGFLEECVNKKQRIQELYVALFFGVNTEICKKLLDFAKQEASATGLQEPIDEISLENLNPTTARWLRRIVIRYRFFENLPQVDEEDVEARNNFLDQQSRYKKDIGSFGSRVYAFFKKNFPTLV